MKIFLFIRGLPASGKITIARELEKKFGWRVLWIHQLKDIIYDIVKKHNLRDLMSGILEMVTQFLLKEKIDIIFVRTAMENITVRRIFDLVVADPEYRFDLVTIMADEETLIKRALGREPDEHRPCNEAEIKDYLGRVCKHERFNETELVLDTSKLSVQEVVEKICNHFGYDSSKT